MLKNLDKIQTHKGMIRSKPLNQHLNIPSGWNKAFMKHPGICSLNSLNGSWEKSPEESK